jgi:hypothetical protein
MDGLTGPFTGGASAAPEIEPGLYYDISHDDYLAMPGLSVSKLKTFSQAPAKARWGEHKETSALRLGTLWHCAVLESDQFEKRYAPTRLERRGTSAWENETRAAMGRELVKQADYDEALYVRDAVLSHPVARALLMGANSVEQSFFWHDPVTGLLCRGRADLLRPDMRVIADVKTTEDASPREFARSIAKYKYHWQDSHYTDGITEAAGWRPEAFVFFAIEKIKPYLVGVYELSARAKERGQIEVRREVNRYAECVRSDVWPGYSQSIETIDLPGWAYQEK